MYFEMFGMGRACVHRRSCFFKAFLGVVTSGKHEEIILFSQGGSSWGGVCESLDPVVCSGAW